jgi:1-acyl-sn-glycerol-3-phosphate acyltransferase
MRAFAVYALLLLIKGMSRLVYRFEVRWIGERPTNWNDVRIGALLNHTSLFEPVLAGALPIGFLKKLAYDGAVPIADVTLRRPLAGLLFRSIAGQVISITRKRDSSWDKVLGSIRPGSMVVIMPEGRMMRRGGLDKTGKPMTVRGGIADLIRATGDGQMVLGYSGGLHHVQAPGDRLPRLFRTIRINFETLDLPAYREELSGENDHKRSFKRAVIADLERRRDEHCPATEETGKPVKVADFDGEVPRDQPLPGM